MFRRLTQSPHPQAKKVETHECFFRHGEHSIGRHHPVRDLEIAQSTLLDWRTILIAVASFVVTIIFKRPNTAFVIAGGAASGYLLSLV